MARGHYYGGSHTRGGQTVPNKRGRDISPAACIRREEANRELWCDLLNRALEQNDGVQVARCERGLAKCEESINFYAGKLTQEEVVA